MARLQILELPEGAGDDRPPFVLVIDEVTAEESERVIDSREAMDGMAKRMGARAVAVFHGMTVDIPANTPAPVADDPERAGTTEIVYAHERTRLDLCSALLVSGDTAWRKLVEHVAERQRQLAGLYQNKDALTEALGMDRLRDWDDIVNAARGLRKERDAQADALERVRNLSTEPEAMNAQQEHPNVWLAGYYYGVLAAKGATRNERATAEGGG
ncbi:hypothetical protein [Streptomyces ipomoeae]|uniref:hypothetical protein n=1 Tax=Streptomyces ipomoeae TaxID=103232 RepID=UPI0029B0FA8F|nr:hypothetical protein [Streptomyces ipomoeae]MDX2697105.1 hypothetical protein [Streptomyces ipomoeae]